MYFQLKIGYYLLLSVLKIAKSYIEQKLLYNEKPIFYIHQTAIIV